MKLYDATEQAYKNGYEKGFKDCLEYLGLLTDYEQFGAINSLALSRIKNRLCDDK